MEREKELTKLVNVLRQTARTAQQAAWTGGDPDAARHCAEQYNRVLARIQELDPAVDTLFQPLAPDSSLMVVAAACRQLAAYYADEIDAAAGWSNTYAPPFDPESFKEFWRKSASEIEDFGEFIRDNVDAWMRRHRQGRRGAPPNDAPGGTNPSPS